MCRSSILIYYKVVNLKNPNYWEFGLCLLLLVVDTLQHAHDTYVNIFLVTCFEIDLTRLMMHTLIVPLYISGTISDCIHLYVFCK